MADRLEHLVIRLKDEGQQTLAFFRAIEPDKWAMQVYDIGPEWNVRQVLCHFVSAEQNLLRLFKSVAKGGEGVPADFNIDQFNAEDVAGIDARQEDELLAQFEGARATMVTFVRGLTEADLDRVGRHPFLGMVAIEKMIKMIYRHNMLHQKDVRMALATGKPVVGNG